MGTEEWPIMTETSYPVSHSPIHIAVLADPHFTQKRHGTWKMLHKTEELVQRAVKDLENDRTGEFDLVVFAGDLTSSGRTADYDAFDAIVSEIDIPSVAIPGNHDINTKVAPDQSITVNQFAERYNVDGYPFHHTVGDVSVIGLDSASLSVGEPPEDWGGAISEHQIRWLRKKLPDISNPIIITHHNLCRLSEHPDEFPWDQFPIENNKEVKEVLVQNGVPLAVSAHHHLPGVNVIRNQGAEQQELIEVMSPAMCSFPQGYMKITVDTDGTVVRYIPLSNRSESLSALNAAEAGLPRSKRIAKLAQKRLISLFG